MDIRYQKITTHHLDGTTEERTVTHIYSKHGHFIPAGWHLELASDKTPSDFQETLDEGVEHVVPDSLPDIEIYEEEDPEEEATVEDYEQVLEEIFSHE